AMLRLSPESGCSDFGLRTRDSALPEGLPGSLALCGFSSFCITWIQRVPNTAHAPYKRALLVAQLFPQVADVYVHHVGITEIIVAPDAVEDGLACEDLARVGKQHFQQVELPR